MLRLARASSVGLRNNRGGGHSAFGFGLLALGSWLSGLGLSQHVAELRSTARTRASGLRGPVLNAQLNTQVRADCSFASLLRMTILNNVGMNLKCFGMTNPKCFRGQF